MPSQSFTTLAALGSAALLAGCGNQNRADAAPAGKAASPAAATRTATPPPAAKSPFFMPPEWLDNLRTTKLTAQPANMQALAMYFYQHPDVARRPENLPMLTALASCADAETATLSEIQRPAIYAKTKAAFDRFLSSPPPAGVLSVFAELGPYDTANQSFHMQGTGVTATGDVAPARMAPLGFTCESIKATGMSYMPTPVAPVYQLSGFKVGTLRMEPAKADAYLQQHGGFRTVHLLLIFTVPSTGGGPDTVVGTLTGAKVVDGNDHKTVIGTYP